jgi:hypothetical protein
MDWKAILKEIAQEGAKVVLQYGKAHKQELEKLLQPYIEEGEKNVVVLANKVSPWFGLAVQEAVAYLGPEVPVFEGNAIEWIIAVLEKFIAS